MDVVGDDREYEWSLDGQRWLQDAHGRFSLTHVAGKALEDEQPDLDFLVGAQQAPGARTDSPSTGDASMTHSRRTVLSAGVAAAAVAGVGTPLLVPVPRKVIW